jgi:phosphatidylglycerophosphate synthase/choline kinase
MTPVRSAQLTVVILAQGRTPVAAKRLAVGETAEHRHMPLAVRRLCGVPLVRRHLQVVRAYEWRQVVVVVSPTQRDAVAKAVGEPSSLGMSVSYVEADEGTFPARALQSARASWFLVLEGRYVIEGALLEALAAAEANAVLCDSRPEHGQRATIAVVEEQVSAWGEQAARATHAYAGAVLLSREALDELAAGRHCSWPGALSELGPLRAVDARSAQLYVPEVRRSVEPFWREVKTRSDAERCKHALVRGAQKHTLDVVAWYVNRPLETALTLRIADWPVTPNQVTLLTSALAYVVTALFLARYWLPASLLTFVVNVLDGVDGKVARVKAMSSKLGQLEHSLDLLYEQSWYIAFTLAAYMRRGALAILVLGFIMLLCDSFARHVSMQFRRVMGVSLAEYAPFDRAFRRFDGRRNIYTLHMLLGIVMGLPSFAVCTMTLHAFLTGLVYFVRAAKHLRAADRGLTLRQ